MTLLVTAIMIQSGWSRLKKRLKLQERYVTFGQHSICTYLFCAVTVVPAKCFSFAYLGYNSEKHLKFKIHHIVSGTQVLHQLKLEVKSKTYFTKQMTLHLLFHSKAPTTSGGAGTTSAKPISQSKSVSRCASTATERRQETGGRQWAAARRRCQTEGARETVAAR